MQHLIDCCSRPASLLRGHVRPAVTEDLRNVIVIMVREFALMPPPERVGLVLDRKRRCNYSRPVVNLTAFVRDYMKRNTQVSSLVKLAVT